MDTELLSEIQQLKTHFDNDCRLFVFTLPDVERTLYWHTQCDYLDKEDVYLACDVYDETTTHPNEFKVIARYDLERGDYSQAIHNTPDGVVFPIFVVK